MTVKREELGAEPPREQRYDTLVSVAEQRLGTVYVVSAKYADWHRKRADAQAELLRRARGRLQDCRIRLFAAGYDNDSETLVALDTFIAELDKQIA